MSVWKDFKSISNRDLTRILDLIKTLGDNPRPSNCVKLSGQDKYRVKHGRYRIAYSIQVNELKVWGVKVRHRKDISLKRLIFLQAKAFLPMA